MNGNIIESLMAAQDDGFAVANDLCLEDLQKALTAGYGTDAATYTGGRSLQIESMDSTLVSVLHAQEDAKIFAALKKEPVGSTVHQYTKRTEVGADDGAWVAEGADSVEADQTLARKTINMKYLQTKRQVTLQMATAKSIEDAQALEANAGTLWLVRNVERKIINGNSTIVTEEPDGLDVQLTTNVLDLRGKDATSSQFEDAMQELCRRSRDNYGKITAMYSSTMVQEDIQKLLRDRIRFPGGLVSDGSAVFDFYPTKFGRPRVEDDVFIREGAVPSISAIAARPSVPVLNSAVAAAEPTSKFVAADAGTYYFKVVGVNKYGQGTPVASAGVVVAAGDKVTLNVTGGATLPTGYQVYRSKKNAADATDCRYAFTVAYTGAGQNIVDINSYLPGVSAVYGLNLDPMLDAVEWNQFLPLMKFQLYPTSAAVWPFLMLLFGALNVKKQEQCGRIINVSYSNMTGGAWF